MRAEGGRIVTTLGKLTGSTLTPLPKKKAVAAEARPAPVAEPKKAEETEDDDLTCSMCLSSFWYKNELLEHMKTTHNVDKTEKKMK